VSAPKGQFEPTILTDLRWDIPFGRIRNPSKCRPSGRVSFWRGRRLCQNLGLNGELLIVAPLDFFVLRHSLEETEPTTTGHEEPLRQPEFVAHLHLFERQLRARD
jgi:hypothetical protein